ILRALATRLGVSPEFYPWPSDDGPLDAILDHESTGRATVAALRAEGGIRALRISHVGHPDLRFPTPSGKVELYSAEALAMGLPPLPTHEAPPASTYPLALRQGRTLAHFHAFYDHGRALPTLARLDPEPELWISPADAAARGVGDGTDIRIHNERGELRARAVVTARIPDGTVGMRDGGEDLNRRTPGRGAAGRAVIPEESVERFGFSGGQAGFDAMVEVSRA